MKSYWCEKNYLNGDADLRLSLAFIRLGFIANEEDELLNAALVDNYNLLIKKTADALKTLNLRNQVECALGVCYVLQEGYFSVNKKYEYATPKDGVPSKPGINMVTGEGNCRNITGAGQDILFELGYNTKRLYCCYGLPVFIGRLRKADHVINLIEHKGLSYGIDMCNHGDLYTFKNGLVLREISFKRPRQMAYKPYYNVLIGQESFDEMLENVKQYERESKMPHLTAEDYYGIIGKFTINRLEHHKDIFEDLHEETKILKQEICEGLEHIQHKHIR